MDAAKSNMNTFALNSRYRNQHSARAADREETWDKKYCWVFNSYSTQPWGIIRPDG
jgi:hypothetical protein